ncbi:hypothetical protein ALCH109712_15660 [Alkalicoccus chagannorensis]
MFATSFLPFQADACQGALPAMLLTLGGVSDGASLNRRLSRKARQQLTTCIL